MDLLSQMNEKVMCGKSLGQIGYEAYCSSTGWKSLISGALLPQWSEVKPEIKLAWETAGGQMVYAAHGQVAMLTDLIGKPPEGSHPDEWQPRDATWHKERQNWINETDKLRASIEAKTAVLKRVLEWCNQDCVGIGGGCMGATARAPSGQPDRG